MKTSLHLFTIFAILLSACGNDGAKTPADPSGDTTSHTGAAPSAKDSSATTPPAGHPDTESVIPSQESDSLKFCYIKKFYQEGNTWFIDADYIQFLFGDKAVAAARRYNDAEMEIKNGDTSYSVLNDYYVLNENPKIRKLAISPNVVCYTIGMGGSSVILEKTSFQQLQAKYQENNYYILILDKQNVVTTIKEQYVP